jgi:hypothetical protein
LFHLWPQLARFDVLDLCITVLPAPDLPLRVGPKPGHGAVESNLEIIEPFGIFVPIARQQHIESVHHQIVDLGMARRDMEVVLGPWQAACSAFQQHPVETRKPGFAVVAMAGPDEVHYALRRHVVLFCTIPDAAPFQQIVTGEKLKLTQLRLDILWTEIGRSVELPFP